jgi:hypothetical protein
MRCHQRVSAALAGGPLRAVRRRPPDAEAGSDRHDGGHEGGAEKTSHVHAAILRHDAGTRKGVAPPPEMRKPLPLEGEVPHR